LITWDDLDSVQYQRLTESRRKRKFDCRTSQEAANVFFKESVYSITAELIRQETRYEKLYSLVKSNFATWNVPTPRVVEYLSTSLANTVAAALLVQEAFFPHGEASITGAFLAHESGIPSATFR
jgi:hypothetical protein